MLKAAFISISALAVGCGPQTVNKESQPSGQSATETSYQEAFSQELDHDRDLSDFTPEEIADFQPMSNDSPEVKAVLAELAAEMEGLNLASTPLGTKILAAAVKYNEAPYEFGAKKNSTESFDCSSLVRRAILDARAASTFKRTARSQGAYLKNHSKVKVIKKTNKFTTLKKGDVIVWKWPRVDVPKGLPTHIGFYGGKGLIYQAGPAEGVKFYKPSSRDKKLSNIYGIYRISKKLN